LPSGTDESFSTLLGEEIASAALHAEGGMRPFSPKLPLIS
jgi:hypothetical protein